MSKRLFTSESVTEGHPDKMADQISDAILDDLLRQDPKSRVAVETMLTTGQVHVAGEVTTEGFADVMKLVRDTVLGIGYDTSDKGFDGNSSGIQVSIGKQSPDIAQGVDDAIEEREGGFGDPGRGHRRPYRCRRHEELPAKVTVSSQPSARDLTPLVCAQPSAGSTRSWRRNVVR